MKKINKNQSQSKNMKLETPKGTKDYLPEQKILRDKVVSIIKEVFESYSFSPLETPTMENLDLLTSKGTGGSAIGKEIYKLTDRKGRKLGLRFDLTIPVSRVLATNPNIPKPFKRYQIGAVYREEFGTRNREFLQCDVDTFGSKSMLADAELLALTQEIFDKLGLKIVIKVNNRRLIEAILDYAGIPKSKRMDAILSVDKLEKFTVDEVIRDAKNKGINEDSMVKVIDILQVQKTVADTIKQIRKFVGAKTALEELEELFKYARALGAKDIKFVPSLARGFDYYTGPVFEVYLKSRPDKLSVAGGGRYDELIGKLSGKDVSATGISFGVDRILDALGKSEQRTVTQLFVIPFGEKKNSLKVVAQLRKKGLKVDIDLVGRNVTKSLEYANKMNIPFVGFLGSKELTKKKIKIKDMQTGKEKLVSVSEVGKLIKHD